MNRDREAIARIVREACVRWEGVAVSTKTILDDAVDAILALPPAGGVEEALRELIDAVERYEPRRAMRASIIASVDRGLSLQDVLDSARAALSPATQGEES